MEDLYFEEFIQNEACLTPYKLNFVSGNSSIMLQGGRPLTPTQDKHINTLSRG